MQSVGIEVEGSGVGGGVGPVRVGGGVGHISSKLQVSTLISIFCALQHCPKVANSSASDGGSLLEQRMSSFMNHGRSAHVVGLGVNMGYFRPASSSDACVLIYIMNEAWTNYVRFVFELMAARVRGFVRFVLCPKLENV